tara:strand:- start:2533 stop:2910 length:378 start_codon:yes stop_codon:yes gene_type:complete
MNGIAFPEIYIGSDIIEVSRVKSLIKSRGQKFLDKIFTNKEQRYCNSKSNPAIHYAGRFAAKEAVMKALKSSGYNKPISFCSISIINSKSGAPLVTTKFVISGSCQITISHTTEYATATALFILS